MTGEFSPDACLSVHLCALETALLSPQTRRSADSLSRLLADDFAEFGSSGRVFNKREIIDALQHEAPEDLSLHDFTLRHTTETMALVTYRTVRRSRSGETLQSLRSSVWVQRDNRWQILFHQGTRLPPALSV